MATNFEVSIYDVISILVPLSIWHEAEISPPCFMSRNLSRMCLKMKGGLCACGIINAQVKTVVFLVDVMTKYTCVTIKLFIIVNGEMPAWTLPRENNNVYSFSSKHPLIRGPFPLNSRNIWSIVMFYYRKRNKK